MARVDVRSTQRFGFIVEGVDPALPLTIEISLSALSVIDSPPLSTVQPPNGEFYAATVSPDTPGKETPFPETNFDGCGFSIAYPRACTDVALYKFTAQGQLAYVTYLAGRTSERPGFLQLAPDGSVVVAGSTDSPDFPTTAGAFQTSYAGPPATLYSSSSQGVDGDFFAVRLDPATGTLRASTFLGGPKGDHFGTAATGADGSLYLFHKWLVPSRDGMPTTRGALQTTCPGDPCPNSYAAHLSLALDELLYGTYLPGRTGATAVLHTDGSLYYAGSSLDGFPTTPTAFQRNNAGGSDAIVARLDPTGTSLMFATYIGTPDLDGILRMAVAPDGSVWADVGSSNYGLVHLDSKGERIVAKLPFRVDDVAVDPQGNAHVKTGVALQNLAVSENAFLANSCGATAYLRLSPTGEPLFATYLPYWVYYDFAGKTPRGLPILQRSQTEFYELDESAPSGVYTGCVADTASFGNFDQFSPGAIITLFGSQMGPREGVAFQLEDGRLPTTFGGTRVFVNGTPIPLLYSSYWQVNAILPETLAVGTRPEVQVVRDFLPGNVLTNSYVSRAGISLFAAGEPFGIFQARPAAALNEDGSVNTAANPAKPGSRVVLFGTGGGETVPPSIAGEVTPLEVRPLRYTAIVKLNGSELPIEYSGAAPGLVAGVIQINVKLPDVIPQAEGYPANVAVLFPETPGNSFYPGSVTIYVKRD